MTPGPDGEPAFFDDAPATSVDFAPRSVRPGRQSQIAAVAWALSLTGLIGIGLLSGGRILGESPEASRPTTAEADGSTSGSSPESAPMAQDHTPLPAASTAPARTADAFELAVAERRTTDARGTIVDVSGTLLVRAARVRITLRDADSQTVDGAFIDVSDPDGGIRPVRAPMFMASFDLARRYAAETLWLVVTAYDEAGALLGGTLRPIFPTSPDA